MDQYYLLLLFTFILRNTNGIPQNKIKLIPYINIEGPFDTKDVNNVSVATIPEINDKGKFDIKDVNANTRVTEETASINEYPLIGILAQEISYALEKIYPGKYESFIAASYVKFVEGGGARVVPIFINKQEEYYQDIMKKVNGYDIKFDPTIIRIRNRFYYSIKVSCSLEVLLGLTKVTVMQTLECLYTK